MSKRRSKLPAFFAYVYLFLPFTIFAIGWLKLWLSIPILIGLILLFLKMITDAPQLEMPRLDKRSVIKLVVIVALVAVWVFFSGIGKFVFQNDDHNTRNVMFEMLVERSWPLIDYNPPAEYYTQPVAFTYYIGFWLPAALVGKLFGMLAGQVAQIIWAIFGILIFYWLVILKLIKKVMVWPLLLFVFFSGMDIVGLLFLGNNPRDVGVTQHLEWWCPSFQFSSFTTQLFWVFNQAIPAWVAVMIMLIQEKSRYMVVVIALVMISSTLPFIGMLPFAVYLAFRLYNRRHGFKNFQLKTFLREMTSVENVIGGGIIALVSFLYLSNNFSSGDWGIAKHNDVSALILRYIIFILSEILVLFVLIYRAQRHRPVYWISLAVLLVVPFIRMGYNPDFCMRVSIPALLIVYLMVTDTLLKYTRVHRERAPGSILCAQRKRRKIWVAALVAVLAVGAVTPLREILRTTSVTVQREAAQAQIHIDNLDPMEAGWRDHFYGGIDNFFYENLVRK